MTIPKIIHLVEPEHNVLSVWQNLHPDWQCIEWSVEGCFAFLKRYYPEAEELFLQYKDQNQRIHMVWYYLLDRYGGVVVEGDRIPKRRIDSLFLSVYDLYTIEDWFVASCAKTDFLKHAHATLPTLKAGWVERMLGGRSLVRLTAVVEPEGAFKKIPKRIYSVYFHLVEEKPRLSKLKASLIIAGALLTLAVYKVWKNIDLWKLRWKMLFPPKRVVAVYQPSPRFDVLPEFTTLKNISLETLEKNLKLPPPIMIPPSGGSMASPVLEISPASSIRTALTTPSSYFSSPVSTASDELVITI